MPQEKVWEKEYRNPIMITKYDKPQADALRFFKYLKKDLVTSLDGLNVLDLGSGTGRNANYLAGKGSIVAGIEISETAIKTAQERSASLNKPPQYFKQSMAQRWPLGQGSIDVILDILSSNCLTENERGAYLSELKRVLKKGGILFVKTLAKDGDKNAQNLIKKFPGPEADTYVMPDLGLTERVFGEEDFLSIYKDFEVLRLEKKFSKVPFNGQVFKRRFLIAYLKLR